MKMKTITTKWAMLIALMTAVSCSENRDRNRAGNRVAVTARWHWVSTRT